MEPASRSAQLGYASEVPRWYRRRPVRRVAFWLALGILAAVVWRWVPPMIEHLVSWYLQRQCMTHKLPKDFVVLTNDAERGKRLAASVPDYLPHPSGYWLHVPPASWRLQGMLGTLNGFIHHRRSPSGNDRLVAVEVIPLWPEDYASSGRGAMLVPRVVEPATLLQQAQLKFGRRVLDVCVMDHSLEVLAGQADSADLSHFTIGVLIDQKRETIDGYLRDDDSIVLVPRSGSVVASSGAHDRWFPAAVDNPPATSPAQGEQKQ